MTAKEMMRKATPENISEPMGAPDMIIIKSFAVSLKDIKTAR
jgi:hypothetical protein